MTGAARMLTVRVPLAVGSLLAKHLRFYGENQYR
jgi:hypothetical protein